MRGTKYLASFVILTKKRKYVNYAVSTELQGDWIRWDSVMKNDLNWNKLIYGVSDRRVFSFLVGSTTNTAYSRKSSSLGKHKDCPMLYTL